MALFQKLPYPPLFHNGEAAMSRKRASMRKIKEVLRLAYFEHMSERLIALGSNTPKTAVHDYLLRAEEAGLTWLEAEGMDEYTIECLLFPPTNTPQTKKTVPDWTYVHEELRRPHVTLQLLWEEYRQEHPEGYSYSQFCELYRGYVRTLDVSMRQTHAPGEKVFVDYSGTRVEVVDPKTGELRKAEVFIAVFGASNYAYAEATWTQRLPDWIGSHTRAMMYFGGVPAAIVPDNLKSGIKDPLYYDPEVNPTYQRWAEYYGVAILPARVRTPKDKAKVEVLLDGDCRTQQCKRGASWGRHQRRRGHCGIGCLRDARQFLFHPQHLRSVDEHGCDDPQYGDAINQCRLASDLDRQRTLGSHPR